MIDDLGVDTMHKVIAPVPILDYRDNRGVNHDDNRDDIFYYRPTLCARCLIMNAHSITVVDLPIHSTSVLSRVHVTGIMSF